MKALHSAAATGIGYNPGIQYIGGQLLAQGINQAGNALAEGLQQYAKNREEASALDIAFDTRAKPIITDLQKFAAQNGQLDPAAEALVDKGAKWHTLGSSQKKQVLADVVLLGDRREKERLQAETKARNEALLKLQQEQLGVSRQGMALEAMRTLSGMFNQSRDNARADRALRLQEQQALETRRRQGELDRIAAEERAALQGFSGDLARFATQDYTPGAGQGMLRPMGMQEAALSAFSRNPAAFGNPNADNMVTALGRLRPSDWRPSVVNLPGGISALMTSPNSAQEINRNPGRLDRPITVTTKEGDNTITRRVTEAELANLPRTAPTPDVPDAAKWRGWLTDLKAAKAAGLKEVDRSQLLGGGGVDTSPWGLTARLPIDDAIKAVEAKLGGSAAPAAGAAPASASSSKLIDEANEAIRRGADPEKVKARLKQLGVTVQ